MKKRKIMLLLPFTALVLGGCSFQDVKNWVGSNIYFPVKNWVEDLFNPDGKKEEKEAKLTKIEVSGQYKDEYEQGEEFDPSGIVVTASYDDGSSKDVSSEATFSGFSSESLGSCKVTVSYGGLTAEFEVTIVKAKITSYSFASVVAAYAEIGIQVEIPDYEGADLNPSYVSSGDYYLIKSSSNAEMQAFAGKLSTAGWALETDNYGDYHGYFGETPAYIYVGDYTQESYAGIIIQFTIPQKAFPAEEIASLFDYYEAPEFSIPEFTGANVYFKAQVYSETGWSADGVRLDVYGATASEIDTYLNTTMVNDGWTIANGLATKVLTDLNGVANVYYQQIDSRDFVLVLSFELTPIPSAGFPSEALASAFQQLGVTAFTIPEPDGEGYTYEYAFNESNINYVSYPNYCYDPLYINNMSQDQFDAYVLKFQEAGWSDSVSDGTHTLTKIIGEKQAKLLLAHYSSETYGDYAFMRIYYVMSDIPKWPTDGAAALVEKFAPGSTTVIPAYNEGTSYTVYNGNTYNEIDVKGPDTIKDDYAAILRTAGWTETAEGSYVFISPAQDIQITLALTSYGLEIRVAAYSAPVPEWPGEELEDLLTYASKDSLPAYSGEASGYSILNDSYGTAVMVSVEEGTESDAIATYVAQLLEAKFTYYEAFGIYVSENGEIAVGAPYMGTSGSFTIPFEENHIISAFPLNEINTFLSTYGLGFQLNAALGDVSGGCYYYPLIDAGSYVGTRIIFAGDQVEAIKTALSSLIPSSYEWDDDEECWFDSTTYHEVDLYSVSGVTYLTFWE